MAGKGNRFVKAGYKTYKPFLQLSKKENIIQNICDSFSKNSNKYFIVDKNLNKNYLKILSKIPNSKIIKIKSHKLGPGYTLLSAEKELKDLKKVFVCYSDIVWKWNKKKLKLKNNTVFCYKNYHPYTKDNNNYAFCKVNKKKLIKLKEKSSFTKKWINEPLSIGLFYYIDAKELFNSLNCLKKLNIKTNNEYFPSEGFNFLENTKIEYVNSFAHIGKPNYYEEFINRKKFFTNEKKFKTEIKNQYLADKIVIPAAGKSVRFKKKNIFTPKHLYLIKELNLKLIDYLIQFLPSKQKDLVTFKTRLIKDLSLKKYKTYFLDKATRGQAETIYKYLKDFKDNQSFFINSCDVFSIFNLKKYSQLVKKSDIIVFASGKSFQELPSNSYTWLECNDNKLKNIFIKNKAKKNLKILTGNFYFNNKKIYERCFSGAQKENLKEIFVDDLIKEAIKLKYNISVIIDDIYVNLGTPELIKDFIFWKNFFKDK